MTLQQASGRTRRKEKPPVRAVIVLLPQTTEEGLETLLDSVRSADSSSEVMLLHGESPALRERLNALTNGELDAEGRRERNRWAMADQMSLLTSREKQVLGLLTEGLSNSRIAESLAISQNTVRAHLRNVMQKLNVANRVQAAAAAMRAGLPGNSG
jgi:DNA-binding NarL/FixJ family response regulator